MKLNKLFKDEEKLVPVSKEYWIYNGPISAIKGEFCFLSIGLTKIGELKPLITILTGSLSGESFIVYTTNSLIISNKKEYDRYVNGVSNKE